MDLFEKYRFLSGVAGIHIYSQSDIKYIDLCTKIHRKVKICVHSPQSKHLKVPNFVRNLSMLKGFFPIFFNYGV